MRHTALFALALALVVSTCWASMPNNANILVIGGTQFMGRLNVEHLADQGHNVTMLNRGRTANPFANDSRVHHFACDRMNNPDRFRKFLAADAFDVIIDYVCFEPRHMLDALTALNYTAGQSRLRHYVFISTDSVYMAAKRPPKHGGFIREEDGKMPKSSRSQRKLFKRNKYQFMYGGNKLKVEQVLESAHASSGFPVTSLRLTDVIGPYDNLGSHLQILETLLQRQPVGTRIQGVRGDTSNYRFSTVYAPDVVRLVDAVVQAGPSLFGHALNVANPPQEAPTMHEYAGLVAEYANVTRDHVTFDDTKWAFLPSTDFGPIDTAKLHRMLPSFAFTPFNDTVRLTTEWYLADDEHKIYTAQLADSDSD